MLKYLPIEHLTYVEKQHTQMIPLFSLSYTRCCYACAQFTHFTVFRVFSSSSFSSHFFLLLGLPLYTLRIKQTKNLVFFLFFLFFHLCSNKNILDENQLYIGSILLDIHRRFDISWVCSLKNRNLNDDLVVLGEIFIRFWIYQKQRH
jgi:hypothetical protein